MMSLDALTQTKSKIWFDGKQGVYNRDVLTDSHLENDTVSSLHQSSGYTALDLGVHLIQMIMLRFFLRLDLGIILRGFGDK